MRISKKFTKNKICYLIFSAYLLGKCMETSLYCGYWAFKKVNIVASKQNTCNLLLQVKRCQQHLCW